MSTSNPYEIARVKARDAAVAEAAQKAADPSAPEIISPLLSPDNEIDLVQFEKLVRQIVYDVMPDILTAELIRRNFDIKAQITAAVVAAFAERFPSLPLPPPLPSLPPSDADTGHPSDRQNGIAS